MSVGEASIIHRQHDLADVVARFHPHVRCRRSGQWSYFVGHRFQAIALDERPDGFGEPVGDHRLETDFARAQGGAGQRQAAAHDFDDPHVGDRSAL